MFVYNDVQGKVIEQKHEEQPNGIFPLPSPRPESSMTENGSISPVSMYQVKALKRTQSMFSMGEEDIENIVREKDDTIIELKNIIRKMEEDMEYLKNGINGHEDGVAHSNGNDIAQDNGKVDRILDGNEVDINPNNKVGVHSIHENETVDGVLEENGI